MASNTQDYLPVNGLHGYHASRASGDERQSLESSYPEIASTSMNTPYNNTWTFIEALESPPPSALPFLPARLPHDTDSIQGVSQPPYKTLNTMPADDDGQQRDPGRDHDGGLREVIPGGDRSDSSNGREMVDQCDDNGKGDVSPTTPPAGFRASVGGQRSGKKEVGLFRSLATINQLVFLVTVSTQALTVVAMITVVFVQVQWQTKSGNQDLWSIDVYLAMYAFAGYFEILVAIDALRLKSTIQLVGILLFAASMIMYSTLIPSQITDALQPQIAGEDCDSDPNLTCWGMSGLYAFLYPYIVAIPVVLGASLLILCFLTWRLFREFGWTLYKKLGANLEIKKMYGNYQIFTCLLKFDFFFFTGFSVQFMMLVIRTWVGIKQDQWEFVAAIVAIPLFITGLILAAVAVTHEVAWLMSLVMVAEVAGMVYFSYKIAIMWMPGPQMDRYVVARKALTVYSSISLAALLLTFFMSIVCFRAFGKGLKDAIRRPSYSSSGKRKHVSYRGEKDDPEELGGQQYLEGEQKLALD